jgi:hypothetical protein
MASDLAQVEAPAAEGVPVEPAALAVLAVD